MYTINSLRTLTKNKRLSNSGFTFIEVLISIVILVMASITAADLIRGSVRAVNDSKEMTLATLLLQKTISELETKMETEGMTKACEKKTSGKFEAPYDRFTWTTFCTEIDFQLSATAAKILEGKESSDNEPTKEDLIQKMILQTASEYITKSLRELHVEVNWLQGKTKRNVNATTHFVKYDEPLTMPTAGINLGG